MTTTNDAPTSANNQARGSSRSGLLLLVRHAESEWNALGKWTGHTDVHITEEGSRQAGLIGAAIKDIELQQTYSSKQIRTFETLSRILEEAGKTGLNHQHAEALNERDYGDYTGLNKWEVLEQLGEDTFNRIRRSWDEPIPNGESLKMVHARAVPFYEQHILPQLLAGQNVLVVSHGNTIRALIKHLEDIDDEAIAKVEMPFGTVLMYHVSADGRGADKDIRQIDIKPSKA